jgi:hypothetical protein
MAMSSKTKLYKFVAQTSTRLGVAGFKMVCEHSSNATAVAATLPYDFTMTVALQWSEREKSTKSLVGDINRWHGDLPERLASEVTAGR